ncbi:MAG: hypothetical protein ACI4QN_03145 [Candidatus Coproplasma sp.]
MKKNFILILLLILCLSAAAFAISGCKSESPKQTNLVFIVGDEECTEYDLGTFHQNDDIIVNMPDVYIKHSDGSRNIIYADDSELHVKYFYNDGSTNRETGNFLNYGYEFSVGTYSVVYTYQEFTINATLVVYEPVTYTAQLTASACRYREQLPAVSITNSLGQNETDFDVYYISKKVYDDLDAASATFKQSLSVASNTYDSENGDILPGEYYVYGKNIKDELSTFSPLKIDSGILTITEKGNVYGSFSYNYEYDGSYVFGQIDLAQVGLSMDYDNPVELVDAKGEKWTDFYLEWVYGDSKIDCTNNNTNSVVKIVPESVEVDGEQIKLFEDLNWGSAKMTIERGKVLLWREGSFLDTVVYNGEPQPVALAFGIVGAEETFINTVTVTKDNQEVTPTIDNGTLLLDSLMEIAEYNYLFELCDKTNYCWVDEETWNTETLNTANKTYTFTILPMESNLSGIDEIWNYEQNGDTYRIKLASGVDEAGQVYITPYEKDSLTVEKLDVYIDGGYTYTTNIEATVRITENDGENYFEITVTNYASADYGCLVVNFKATGADHYADIDKTIIINGITPPSE